MVSVAVLQLGDESTSSGRSEIPFLEGGAGLSRKISTF